MRDNTFTPGPWHVCESDDESKTYIQEDKDNNRHPHFATIRTDSWWGNGEGKANARLIAAAPDMYDALWEAIELSDRTLPPSGRTPECQRVYDIVRAALAKAEGE